MRASHLASVVEIEHLGRKINIIALTIAQVLHPQSMRPARDGEIPVRVKNSYNPKAPGTLITKTRDMSKVWAALSSLFFSFFLENLSVCKNSNILDLLFLPQSIPWNQLQAVLTSIVLKQNVTLLDIVSTRMLGQVGFLAKVRNSLFPWFCFCSCHIAFPVLEFLIVIVMMSPYGGIHHPNRCSQPLKIWAFLWMLLQQVKSVYLWHWIHQSFGVEN